MQDALIIEVGCRDHILAHAGQFPEGGVLHGGLTDKKEVPGGGVLLAVMEAVGIGEMGVLAAQLLRALVHGGHKGADVARDHLGQEVARVIGRRDHNAGQHVPHRHGLANLNVRDGGARHDPLVDAAAGGDLLVQGELAPLHRLYRQEGGHHLGQARGVDALMGSALIEDLGAIGHVHQNGGGGSERGVLQSRRRRGESAQDKDQSEKRGEETEIFHWDTPVSVI